MRTELGPGNFDGESFTGLPVSGSIGRWGRWGWRPASDAGGIVTDEWHWGIDIVAALGTPIRALGPGRVAAEGLIPTADGNYVLIEHPDGYLTRYLHMRARALVKRGDAVGRGQVIGFVGSTGRSRLPHLHLSVEHPGGGSLDPLKEIAGGPMAIDWMPDVEHIPTEAVGGPLVEPLAVMSHIMEGYQKTMINWARERPAATMKSAHFTISRTGRIVQHVGIRTQAWHAGRLDAASPTWRLLPAGGNPNDYTVGIEHEGFSGEPWPRLMTEASINVHQWVMEELGLPPHEDRVIGHYMTAPSSRAHDPGKAWPRGLILASLYNDGDASELTDLYPGKEGMRQYEIDAINGFFEVPGYSSHAVEEDGILQIVINKQL